MNENPPNDQSPEPGQHPDSHPSETILFREMIGKLSHYTQTILRMQVNAITRELDKDPQPFEEEKKTPEQELATPDRKPNLQWEAITCTQHEIMMELAKLTDYLISTTQLNQDQQKVVKINRDQVHIRLTMLNRAFNHQ